MTKELFLEDSYLKTMTATILEIHPEAPGKWKLVLSETVFYPKGGGQPSDQGILFTEDWKGKIYQVLSQEGKILHYVEAATPPPSPGEKIQGELDWERRYLNMRLHSAGHIINFALHLLKYELTPLKADHGKKATIWYQGILNVDFRETLESKANTLISEDLRFSTQFVSHDVLTKKALYIQPNLPTNKPLRMLTLETVGSVADGGTQVCKTKEIGRIRLLPIEVKDGTTLIRYSIE